MIIDRAGHEGYRATAGTDVEVGGLRPKPVLRSERRITDLRHELRVTMGSPASSVFGAESATTGPDRDPSCIAGPIEHEANISTVAFAFDSHDGSYRES